MTETIAGSRISPQQKRLWVLQQFDGQIYQSFCCFRLRGSLDRQRLQESLSTIVARHEILRTIFKRLPGMTIPVQVVEDTFEVDLVLRRFEELSAAPEPSSSALEAENSGVAVEQRPLIKIRLTELCADEHELIISLPTLCADFASFANILFELARIYADPAHPSLAPTPQYADIAEWQNQMLESTESDMGPSYWREVSSSGPLFRRRVQPARPDSRHFVQVPIESELGRKILSLAEQTHTAAETVLLSCWQILLWRISLEQDIAIGVYSSGRNYEELVDALGLFAKYLPFNSHLEPSLKFTDVLAATQRRLHDMRLFQEYYASPAERSGDAATVPQLFAYGFEFVTWPQSRTAGGVTISMTTAEARFDRFDLKLACAHQGPGLVVTFEYDGHVFDSSEVTLIAQQMRELLRSAADEPAQAIRDLSMLGEFERNKLLVDWNPSPGATNAPLIHELIHRHAEQTPNARAVICGNEQLSYGELDERAALVAAHLRHLGVGPESRVAICMRRSVALVVALLGVLKSGAAYLPLDPAFPEKRLNFMIEDASAEVLLTEESMRIVFEASTAEMVCLDADWLTISRSSEGKGRDANMVFPENSAYLIYTSGSTGQPKAVVIEHRQLANYVRSIVERCELNRVRDFANVSTLATDLGNTAIFSSLCSGGCLHLVPQALANDADLFWAYAESNGIAALKIVPSHLALLLDEATAQRLKTIELLILGGEAADPRLIDRVRGLNPDCRIFNHYGPTETTIGVLTYQVPGTETADDFEPIPLGRPLRNVTAYVLDARMHPVSTGVAGELYIGGAAVGRGYLGRADLTAERFLPNPFELTTKGERLYRTGDLARFRADGNIEFLGRLDQQLKIRGHRVELGEIEATVRQHPSVRTAVVTTLARPEPGASLIAYIVPDKSSDLPDDGPALRHFLEERLPQHMIPSAFVVLDRLPLAASGKIDFARLPLPVSDAGYVAPRSRVEEIMAEIWEEVLSVKRVGVFDNFFDRGGHSISAARLVARVRQAFHVDVEVVSVFELPTIASFVVVLAQRLVEQADVEQVTELIDELESAQALSTQTQSL